MTTVFSTGTTLTEEIWKNLRPQVDSDTKGGFAYKLKTLDIKFPLPSNIKTSSDLREISEQVYLSVKNLGKKDVTAKIVKEIAIFLTLIFSKVKLQTFTTEQQRGSSKKVKLVNKWCGQSDKKTKWQESCVALQNLQALSKRVTEQIFKLSISEKSKELINLKESCSTDLNQMLFQLRIIKDAKVDTGEGKSTFNKTMGSLGRGIKGVFGSSSSGTSKDIQKNQTKISENCMKIIGKTLLFIMPTKSTKVDKNSNLNTSTKSKLVNNDNEETKEDHDTPSKTNKNTTLSLKERIELLSKKQGVTSDKLTLTTSCTGFSNSTTMKTTNKEFTKVSSQMTKSTDSNQNNNKNEKNNNNID